MATTNITLDDILDMNMEEFQDAISSISKSELNKTEMLLSDYARTTSARNQLENKVALKLNYIKNSKKTKKSLKTVIAKVQDEIKQESTQNPKNDKTQKPRNSSLSNVSIKNSSDTPKNTGTNYNYQRGQGDFFGKASAFKFLKDALNTNQSDNGNENQSSFDFGDKAKRTRKSSAQSSNIMRVNVTEFDFKALRQLKAIGGLGGSGSGGGATRSSKGEGNKPKRTARRATKFEKDNQALRARDADIRERHVEVISEKTKAAIKLTKLKSKFESDKSERKFKQKLEELQEKHKHNTDRLGLSNTFQVNREKLKQIGKEHSDEVRIKLKKMAFEHSRNIVRDKLDIQFQKSKLARSHQIHRDLHSIHPALGAIYGMSLNRQQKQQNNGEGGGGGGSLASILGGGAAGGVGAVGAVSAVKKYGAKALKFGGGKAPIIGALITTYYESLNSGIERGLVAGAGSFAGGIAGGKLGAIVGTAIAPGLGTLIVGGIGMVLGSIFGPELTKDMYDKIKNGKFANKNLGNPNFQFSNQNTPTGSSPTKVASGKIRGAGDTSKNFLANQEGMNLNAYLDGANMKTGKDLVSIGRGHQIKEHEYAQGYIQAGDDRVAISGNNGLDTKLTKKQAEDLYKTDEKIYSDIARRDLGSDVYDKLTEKQKEALTSYAYNVGSLSGLNKHGLKEKLKSGDIQGASDIIRDNGIRTSKGKYNEGMNTRRNLEASMFVENSESKVETLKAPSKAESLSNSTDKLQQNSMSEKSKPINVVNVGGSSGGSASVVNNTYVNPVNTDSTLRQCSIDIMTTGRLL